MHELQLHDTGCFLNLTYDETHLPEGQTLVRRDIQLFLKRLRKARGAFRFMYCGEYGDANLRPHYHAIIFGLDFRHDQRPLRRSHSGEMLYSSPSLTSTWSLGEASIGSVTFESCAYVARYIVKKVTGPDAVAHYGDRLPEFFQPSLKPGLGHGWITKYRSDVYPSDEVVIRDGIVCAPPRYYDKQQEVHVGERAFATHKRIRSASAFKHKPDNTPERLAVREEVANARLKQLKRPL